MLFWTSYNSDGVFVCDELIKNSNGEYVSSRWAAQRAIENKQRKKIYAIYVTGKTDPVTHVVKYSRLAAKLQAARIWKNFECIKYIGIAYPRLLSDYVYEKMHPILDSSVEETEELVSMLRSL